MARIPVFAAVALLAMVGGVAVVATAGSPEPGDDLPVASTAYLMGDTPEAYTGFMMSGGPPPDGIPSIDDPVFISASDASLDPGSMVIGFVHEGDARAYPHNIMVHHEIVNDVVQGLNVAITYCPLTATAQGFERGGTTLGVSGQLLNSNLVMYDRATGSHIPQIAATGIDEPIRGQSLVELDLVWTTWERWQAAHPDTRVLDERTGHLRNYARDPYGSYNPIGGYYAQNRTIFPLMHESNRHHTKEMVVGARTSRAAAYFVLSELASDRVLSTESFVAVYDHELHSAFIYRRGEGEQTVSPTDEDGIVEVDGQTFAADALPLERVVSVQAFFFAWHAFYPNSEQV